MADPPSPAYSEPDPPNAAEAAALLNEAWRDPDWGLLLWLTMITGSRRGEVSALRWHHIEFEREVVWLDRSSAQPKSGLKEKETKQRQRRKISLDPETLALLKAHRDIWAERCASIGLELSPDAFVFSPAPDGSKPYAPRSLTQRYRRMAQKIGLRSTRLHSLRHYSATPARGRRC
ncbi:tyrosine-type recombinase/integrase [Pseudonocardia sp.]|jgi:integrase|uniref:tyrosine-type recombinase/integrase n=1 Tax=Pseudonocardia sp. TaxID=60912 RepID=UPI002ED9A94A